MWALAGDDVLRQVPGLYPTSHPGLEADGGETVPVVGGRGGRGGSQHLLLNFVTNLKLFFKKSL